MRLLLGAVAEQMVQEARAAGLGKKSPNGAIQVQEKIAGVEVVPKERDRSVSEQRDTSTMRSTRYVNTLYFVRHGENPANLTREFSYKMVDYPLTENGIQQAEQTAAYFASRPARSHRRRHLQLAAQAGHPDGGDHRRGHRPRRHARGRASRDQRRLAGGPAADRRDLGVP